MSDDPDATLIGRPPPPGPPPGPPLGPPLGLPASDAAALDASIGATQAPPAAASGGLPGAQATLPPPAATLANSALPAPNQDAGHAGEALLAASIAATPAGIAATPAGIASTPAGIAATQASIAAKPAGPVAAPAPNQPEPVAAARAPSPLQTLAEHPDRFDIDQAAFVIARNRDAVELPYATVARLGLPLSEVTGADLETRALSTPLFGLIGPGGTLPRHYTAQAGAELRRRSRALQAFLDMLARRFTGMWIRAGAKYRPAREPLPAERALDAAIGMGTPGLAPRIAVPAPSLRYHAGHLAARTRSAERLRAMLAEECGAEVEIVEFAGGWLRLPPSEQSRIGVVHGRLGVDVAAGAQVWDPQARFIIRLGPLDAADFERLLPGRPLFERLCGLTRLFVGPEQDFVLNPILAADAVPSTRTGAAGGRLGLTAWMGQSQPRRRPAADAFLRPTPL